MGYQKFDFNAVCNKCGAPLEKISRIYYETKHDIVEDKKMKKCKIVGEHLHFYCCCGYEIITRPLDWNKNKINKKKGK